MSKIKKFNESVGKKYVGDGEDGSCPNCGEYKNIEELQPVTESDSTIFSYHCGDCGFDWYAQYLSVYDAHYSYGEGDEIYTGEPVDQTSFNVRN